ncbi:MULTISPECIES: enolase C-terminal domain-like protein [unclassified Microbacterium]|uniref:enolase C-terminal domain-like protein n=3 Tax=Bacteria TaxID=2 RepID=UPI000D00FC3D|nr:enolase C-terminal domain-like protein [Microbacterium sp. MYb45]PRB59141.1 glucarate dehydratase [Microbacterium sp. MYb45]
MTVPVITDVRITPVAFADPPLLNAAGVHEPLVLRSIVEVRTDTGLTGLGETYGDADILALLRRAGEAVIGATPYRVGRLFPVLAAALGAGDPDAPTGMTRKLLATIVAPFDTAFHDLQGQIAGVPVWALLGGRQRDAVDYSGYLFYKWDRHPGAQPDAWGAALDAEAIVAQAQRMIDTWGFRSLKLKGGVFPPDQEAEAIERLHEAFPEVPLRVDPNGTWDVRTAVRIASRLEHALEYYEDPTPGIPAMAEVAQQTSLPLATNMCVVEQGHINEGFRRDAVQVVLIDHHYWGGFRPSMQLAATCAAMNVGISMHSNSHLGISLAAMLHLGASVEKLDYALDTHWPWKRAEDDVVADTSHLTIRKGAITVPDRPGLGVEIDESRLQRLHEAYVETTIRRRDDTGYIRQFQPDFDSRLPRWFEEDAR